MRNSHRFTLDRNRTTTRGPRRRLLRRGFALVVSLVLLVLLTTLSIGLLSLSSISLRGSQQADAQAEARQNARLALMLALGELQGALGPDQRINAPSGILAPSDSDGSGTVNHPHLTGVWHSRQEQLGTTPDYDREGPFIRWLVSAADEDIRDTGFTRDGDFSDPVEMVSRRDEEAAGEDPREVRAGGIGTPGNGRLAWWIGDENAKGYTGGSDLAEREGRQSVADSLARTATPGSHGLQAVHPDYPSNTEQSDKVVTLESMEFAMGEPAARSWFHHLTPHARGVLANVAAGGLRKDLSLYIEQETRLPAWPAARPGPTGPNGKYALSEVDEYDVLAWKYLIHHDGYRKRLDRVNGRPTLRAWVGRGQTQFDDNLNPRWNAGVLRPAPVLIRCLIFIAFGSVPDPQRPGQHSLRFYAYPVLTFWNPYNVDLVVTDYNSFLHSMPMDHQILINGRLRDTFDWRNQGNGNGVKPFFARPITFKSGEAKMLSPIRWNWDSAVSVHYAHYLDEVPFQYSPSFAGGEWGNGQQDQAISQAYGRPSDRVEIRTNVSLFGDGSGSAYGQNRNYQATWDIRGNHSAAGDGNWEGFQWSSKIGWRYESGSPSPNRLSSTNLPRATFHEIHQAPRPFMVIDAKLKALDEDRFPNKTWRDCIPCHPFQAVTPGSEGVTPYFANAYTLSFESINSFQEASEYLQTHPDNPIHTYFGGSHFPAEGSSFITSREIPTSPLTSLAQLQHVPQHSIDNLFSSGHFFQNHAIGNSHASPGVRSDRVREGGWPFWHDVYMNGRGGNISGQKFPEGTYHTRPHIDRSYAANHLLWDDYFFSSIAGQDDALRAAGEKRGVGAVARDFFVDGTPLPNERHIPYFTGDPEAVADSLARSSRVVAGAYAKSAAHLMVEGAFNINSVSIPAWKTLLASAHRKRMVVLDAQGGAPNLEDARNFVVSRFTMPNGGSADAEGGRRGDELRWQGYRELDETQIDELAAAIVREVRDRGPFRSLAEFVNRRLAGESDERSLHGALQAALESPEVSINSDYRDFVISPADLGEAEFNNPAAATGPRYQGTPAYVSQADLLNTIGPVLSARSDTFRLRGYGESRDPDGKVLSRAWCEAIVQRVPDYLVPDDSPWIATDQLSSTVNRRFGRRIGIVSFRWLAADEI